MIDMTMDKKEMETLISQYDTAFDSINIAIGKLIEDVQELKHNQNTCKKQEKSPQK